MGWGGVLRGRGAGGGGVENICAQASAITRLYQHVLVQRGGRGYIVLPFVPVEL
jgi:hypothetical protein